MLQRFTKRKCPRCGGNICINEDYYFEGFLLNWYKQASCLQCGRTIDNAKESFNTKATVAGKQKAAAFK